jgi:SAM-dependent methyltransferase
MTATCCNMRASSAFPAMASSRPAAPPKPRVPRGIEIVEEFFGRELAGSLAAKGRQADLIAANNVLAHVPDINDFVGGFATLLKPEGVATFEFPHLYEMVRGNQFDTAYHEHYSYLSLLSVKRIFDANGLTVFDVETTPHHGGSLRVFACRSDHAAHQVTPAVEAMLDTERRAGMDGRDFYSGFQVTAEAARDGFRNFLAEARAVRFESRGLRCCRQGQHASQLRRCRCR